VDGDEEIDLMDRDFSHFESEMNRGFLHLLVLMLLESPLYGYRMLKTCQEMGYDVEENTLYPLLRRLERMQLIQSEWNITGERPRKIYTLTSQGRMVRDRLWDIRSKQERILDRLAKGEKSWAAS
jgi:DNA-binding PadR family transcriptional regulator